MTALRPERIFFGLESPAECVGIATAGLFTARILLGMDQSVADRIARLKFEEIDRIAHKRFRHVRPRWDDRPAVWRRLLLAAQSNDAKLLGAVNLHALQLLTGELISAAESGGAPLAAPRA